MHGQRNFLSLLILAVTALPSWGQELAPAAAQASGGKAASIPDFSGIWGRYSFPGLAAPLSGLGPVVNKSRRRQSFDDNGRPFAGAANAPLVSNNTQLVGDYTNPVLKPQAAQVVKE